MPFINGFLVGFAMIVFVGPVLFTILQISLEKGVISGLVVALGVFISDVICVIICYYGANLFIKESTNDLLISILGIVILISIGLKYFLKPNLSFKVGSEISTLSLIGSFTKGFLVNLVNPFVFAVWITVMEMAKKQYQSIDLWIYLLAATFAVLVTDSLKVVFAQQLRPILNPKLLKKVYKVIGILLMLFGCRLIYHTFITLNI